ncbi:hypothetical protein [Citricoccus sp. NR2]|nr:hypothetical protein [Citricoccus sp. NR2]WBL18493.1 hypothetical protein O1A05_12095 [Citricoccus sp. NR2]
MTPAQIRALIMAAIQPTLDRADFARREYLAPEPQGKHRKAVES